ncbi:MAG: hypothetical protein JSW12_22410 [Deltaproteobacteria bacterium]|nr:MAG: hypothetical protein JSW12_22410 [Deltaproteobacteria bacterium]
MRHFIYVRLDAASTFWRYVDSLGINQANSLLKIMSILRERVWQQCHLKYQKIHASIDTTAETIYGNQQGGRKGYNPQHKGKRHTDLFFISSMKPENTFSGNFVRVTL